MSVTPIRTFLGLVCSATACLMVATCEFGGAKMYCAAALSPAVIVTPLDSGTRANVAVGTGGVVSSGTYVDSLRVVFDSTLWGGRRLGTYQVTVEHAGYRQWVRSGVRVTEQTDCGMPVSVHVTALLQPSP